jgi:hypothetical protein
MDMARLARFRQLDSGGRISPGRDPPSPLLTVREHEELLSMIAEETWVSRTATLAKRMLEPRIGITVVTPAARYAMNGSDAK